MLRPILTVALCSPVAVLGQTASTPVQIEAYVKSSPDTDGASKQVVLPSGLAVDVFSRVEQQAEFIGNLPSYLADKLSYPEDARKAEASGRVILRFIILEDGRVEAVEMARGSGNTSLDKEAQRVASSMPAWKPARVGDKAVASYFSLPVTFALN